MHLSCIVIASYLLKAADTPPAFVATLWVTSIEFGRDLWYEKTRFPWVSCGVIFANLRLAVFIQYRKVTDTYTHRQTHADSIYSAMMW